MKWNRVGGESMQGSSWLMERKGSGLEETI
jgi:hypothetical protein